MRRRLVMMHRYGEAAKCCSFVEPRRTVNEKSVLKRLIKRKEPKLEIKAQGGAENENDLPDEVELQKRDWQNELERIGADFLVLKSTDEQKKEGRPQVVDTAVVGDRDGLPVLKAVFDVQHFTREEIELNVVDDQLVVEATSVIEKEDRTYTKRLMRKLDVPKFVDAKMMHADVQNGVLTVEMPFHLPPQRKPKGINVFPIVSDADGRRKIRLAIHIGSDFTNDDLQVRCEGRRLIIRASYEAEIGKTGHHVTEREFKREYILPERIEVASMRSALTPEGKLFIELLLKDDAPFRAQVEAEEIMDGLPVQQDHLRTDVFNGDGRSSNSASELDSLSGVSGLSPGECSAGGSTFLHQNGGKPPLRTPMVTEL